MSVNFPFKLYNEEIHDLLDTTRDPQEKVCQIIKDN